MTMNETAILYQIMARLDELTGAVAILANEIRELQQKQTASINIKKSKK